MDLPTRARQRPLRPRATTGLAVSPATVTDRTAPHVLGLEPRAFRELIAREHIPHARLGRRVVARLELVLDALDRLSARDDGAASVPAEAPGLGGASAVLASIGLRRVGKSAAAGGRR